MGEQLNIFLLLRFTLGVCVTVGFQFVITGDTAASDGIGEFTGIAADLLEAGGHAASSCSSPECSTLSHCVHSLSAVPGTVCRSRQRRVA